MTRLIDADTLKNEIHNKSAGPEDLWDTMGILNLINKAPTVEERPQGEWIPLNSRFGNLDRYMCSICGHEIRCFPSDLTRYKSCYCGARMEKDQYMNRINSIGH